MKQEETNVRDAERQAANLLMKEYVANHSGEIARIMTTILPFFEECTYHGLQSCMNTVNVTFASVALDVIKSSHDNDPDSVDRLLLPADVEEMKSAIFYLSKIISMLGSIAALAESHSDDPAINMCMKAYSNSDILGTI